jgi:hypothetical protein
LSIVALAGCATAGSLSRGESDVVHLTYDAPAGAVFVAALEAVAGGEFEVTSQDQRLGEIRLRRGPYQHGLFVCYGNVLGVFLTSEGETRTNVEIVERYFSRAQLVGCRAQTPAYVERLNAISGSRVRRRRDQPLLSRSGRRQTGQRKRGSSKTDTSA